MQLNNTVRGSEINHLRYLVSKKLITSFLRARVNQFKLLFSIESYEMEGFRARTHFSVDFRKITTVIFRNISDQ